MKKIIVIFLSLLITSTLYAETLRIMTINGEKVVRVKKESKLQQVSVHVNYFGQKAIMYIRGCYLENKTWTKWEILFQTGLDSNITKEDMEQMMEGTFTYAYEGVDEEGKNFVYVPIKNGDKKFWWEKERYLVFLRRIYYIDKD
jgi:hypothetical protein